MSRTIILKKKVGKINNKEMEVDIKSKLDVMLFTIGVNYDMGGYDFEGWVNDYEPTLYDLAETIKMDLDVLEKKEIKVIK